jgi:hypothetical protein
LAVGFDLTGISLLRAQRLLQIIFWKRDIDLGERFIFLDLGKLDLLHPMTLRQGARQTGE